MIDHSKVPLHCMLEEMLLYMKPRILLVSIHYPCILRLAALFIPEDPCPRTGPRGPRITIASLMDL